MMAGSDLPDAIYMYARPGSASTLAAASGVPQFLQAKCEDLTPYLAGDAAKDYPYLAAIPTVAWKNAGCAFQGHLYMLPLERYVAGQALFKNVNIYDAEIGKDYVPKNAEDLKKVYQQLNRPSEGRFATASYQNQAFYIAFYSAMHGAPMRLIVRRTSARNHSSTRSTPRSPAAPSA